VFYVGQLLALQLNVFGMFATESAVLQKFQFFLDLFLVFESVVDPFLALSALYSDQIIL